MRHRIDQGVIRSLIQVQILVRPNPREVMFAGFQMPCSVRIGAFFGRSLAKCKCSASSEWIGVIVALQGFVSLPGIENH